MWNNYYKTLINFSVTEKLISTQFGKLVLVVRQFQLAGKNQTGRPGAM